jgi:hypothetical protein
VKTDLTAPGDLIRGESLTELKSLAGWFSLVHGTTIIVIGGWAVFSYNPYLGSFDIDCVGPREPFYAQLDLYMASHGYELVKRDQIGLTKFFVRHVTREASGVGDIHIDACSFEDENYFKESEAKKLPYGLCAKNEFINRRQIDDTFVWVPIKELLFLYKLKALRDREWAFKHEKHSEEENYYFQGKIAKDKTDLLALLDPRYGAQDPAIISEILKKLELQFVMGRIKDLPKDEDAIQNYRTKKEEVELWVSRILGKA